MKIAPIQTFNYYNRTKQSGSKTACSIPYTNNYAKYSANNINFYANKFENTILVNRIKKDILNTSQKASKVIRTSIKSELQPFTEVVKLNPCRNEFIEAWDINAKKSDKYIIFLHGLSQNISANQELYTAIAKNTDYGILAIEYRGYGNNESSLNNSEKDFLKDINAGYKYLKDKKVKDIALAGHSFGAYMTAKGSNAGNKYSFQLLISPIYTAKGILKRILKYPKRYKMEYNIIKYIPYAKKAYEHFFDIEKELRNNRTATYIIHSTEDTYISQDEIKKIESITKNFQHSEYIHGCHKMDTPKIESIIKTINLASTIVQ